jgi:hypothetical protein
MLHKKNEKDKKVLLPTGVSKSAAHTVFKNSLLPVTSFMNAS